MSDDILDRIDSVLGHEETVIGVDWEVSGDAMRSRPPGDGDTPYEPEIDDTLGYESSIFGPALLGGMGVVIRRRPAPPVERGRVLELLDRICALPALQRIVVALNRVLIRVRFRKALRTMTVTLDADITGFTNAIMAAEAGMRVFQAEWELASAKASAGMQRLVQAISEQQSRAQIRAQGAQQLQFARLWFEHHVNGVYADLGLDRPQKEPHS